MTPLSPVLRSRLQARLKEWFPSPRPCCGDLENGLTLVDWLTRLIACTTPTLHERRSFFGTERVTGTALVYYVYYFNSIDSFAMIRIADTSLQRGTITRCEDLAVEEIC